MAFLLSLAGLGAPAPPAVVRGELVENVASRSDSSQTYTLYLPKTAAAGKTPALLILDPRGRGTVAAAIFRQAAEQYGWILVSSNQSGSDVDDDRNERAVRALFPELQRWGSDPARIYATGFSGTAMIAWSIGIRTGKLAGVIGVGGRLVPEVPPQTFSFAHFGFAGSRDFNNREMREIEEVLAQQQALPHRLLEFDGDHRWIDSALAVEAIRWMEIVAMKQGRRSRDEELVARGLASDLAAAADLERSGSRLAALRRHRAIVATFDGLADVAASKEAMVRLASDREVERQRREETKWDDFEKRFVSDVLARTPALYAALRRPDGPPAQAHLEKGFRLRELKQRAAREGAEGRAASRLLEALFSQTSFYMTRKLFEEREYRLAVATLQIAVQIHSDRWPVHYNLGAAWARLGDRRQAVGALERAVELGFADAAQLRADPDFASLAGDARFDALLARLGESR